jgi:hypothetical protein
MAPLAPIKHVKSRRIAQFILKEFFKESIDVLPRRLGS